VPVQFCKLLDLLGGYRHRMFQHEPCHVLTARRSSK
jgi:hypothetical protein